MSDIRNVTCNVCGCRATVARRKSVPTGGLVQGRDPQSGKPVAWQEFKPDGPMLWWCKAHAPAPQVPMEYKR